MINMASTGHRPRVPGPGDEAEGVCVSSRNREQQAEMQVCPHSGGQQGSLEGPRRVTLVGLDGKLLVQDGVTRQAVVADRSGVCTNWRETWGTLEYSLAWGAERQGAPHCRMHSPATAQPGNDVQGPRRTGLCSAKVLVRALTTRNSSLSVGFCDLIPAALKFALASQLALPAWRQCWGDSCLSV